jgi:hypothetical protein
MQAVRQRRRSWAPEAALTRRRMCAQTKKGAARAAGKAGAGAPSPPRAAVPPSPTEVLVLGDSDDECNEDAATLLLSSDEERCGGDAAACSCAPSCRVRRPPSLRLLLALQAGLRWSVLAPWRREGRSAALVPSAGVRV